MRLCIVNGSPRGEESNTKLLLEQFLRGYKTVIPNADITFCHLNQVARHSEYVKVFNASDVIVFAYPLYADSMPSIVKAFIEELNPSSTAKKIVFMVQSGFPESIHSEATAKYMEKLAIRLNLGSAGVIIRPGAEGIRTMPYSGATKKLFNNLENLGAIFAKTKKLDRALLKEIRGVRKFSVLVLPLLFVFQLTGIINIGWNRILKKNKAYKKRFDRPYL